MKHLKNRKEFLLETGVTYYGGQRTSGAVNHASNIDTEYSFGNTHNMMPNPKRGFVYYSWKDFINADFKVYQKDIKEKDPIEFGVYQLKIGNENYLVKPAIVYEHKVTNVHLVDIYTNEIISTISQEIPESKKLKEGEFFINPNVDEYESIIEQLIEQGFMTKKEDSDQIVGAEPSDVYKVLGF